MATTAEGLAALEQGNFEAARKAFFDPAEAGDAVAQYHMGALYQSGLGGEKSESKALRYIRSAAEKGLMEAEFTMGVFYHRGKAWLDKNPDLAVAWYTKAAEQGSPAAQFNLGMMFATGEGVPLSYGSNPDYIKARKWFLITLASMEMAEDKEKVQTILADMEQHMTPGQIERADSFAQDWLAARQK
ncbi:MAG: tetratricopeptide repeat protein [Magnetospiraceae bacterium]